jgi:DNA modification methylase
METLFVNKNKIDSSENSIVIYDNQDKSLYKAEEIRNKIILGNALDVLRKIESDLFDMVFIDPPYFLQLQKKKLKRWNVKTDVEGVFDEWDKFSSFEEYDDFIQSILKEVKRVMKENATIWVTGTYHNIFRIGKIRRVRNSIKIGDSSLRSE